MIPVGFIASRCLVEQGLDGHAVHLLEELPGYRFELFQDGGGLAFGFRLGLRFLSLRMLTVALLLWRAARGLHALPGPVTTEVPGAPRTRGVFIDSLVPGGEDCSSA